MSASRITVLAVSAAFALLRAPPTLESPANFSHPNRYRRHRSGRRQSSSPQQRKSDVTSYGQANSCRLAAISRVIEAL